MKTFAIAAVLAASVAASPAAIEKRATITPVTIKGNGEFRTPPTQAIDLFVDTT